MASSAAFSMNRIIIGVASTGGNAGSLNGLARCSGPTIIENFPWLRPGSCSRTQLLQGDFIEFTDSDGHRHVTLRQFRYFIAVAEGGSVASALRMLDIAQAP